MIQPAVQRVPSHCRRRPLAANPLTTSAFVVLVLLSTTLCAEINGARETTHEMRTPLPIPANADTAGARIVALTRHMAATSPCDFCATDLTLAHLDLTDDLNRALAQALTTSARPLRLGTGLTEDLGMALLGEARKARLDRDTSRANRYLRAAAFTFSSLHAQAPDEAFHGLHLALVRLEQSLLDPRHREEARKLLQAFLHTSPHPTVGHWVRGLIQAPETLLSEVADPQAPDRTIHVSGNIEVPVPILKPGPRYSVDGLRRGIEGVVILQTVIDRNGVVQPIRMLKDLPAGLGAEALRAVATWQFAPARRNGEAVAVHYNVIVPFRLEEAASADGRLLLQRAPSPSSRPATVDGTRALKGSTTTRSRCSHHESVPSPERCRSTESDCPNSCCTAP